MSAIANFAWLIIFIGIFIALTIYYVNKWRAKRKNTNERE